MRSGWARGVSAWFWSLQFALLNPVLAVLLTSSFGASGHEAGLVLATYNAAGFVASVVVPAITDRRGRYVGGMLFSALCGVGFAVTLLLTDQLFVAAAGLVLLGAPAAVGATLLFADLRHGGASPEAVVRIRAVVSFAWVLGPPMSTLVASIGPPRAVLALIGGIGVVNALTSLLALRRPRPEPSDDRPRSGVRVRAAFGSARVWALLTVFVALQMLNGAAVTAMGLFVTRELSATLVWSGVALGVSAFAEIPALLVVGRLLRTWSARTLVSVGAAVGAVYYVLVALVHAPLPLVLLQPLNAWFFATIAGVGLTAFQQTFAAPGFAAGLFANTRQVSAVLSGALIAVVSGAPGGYRDVYWTCAVGAGVIAIALAAAARVGGRARCVRVLPDRRRPTHAGVDRRHRS